MKLNFAVCDDEENQREYLKASVNEYISEHGQQCSINAFPSAEAFLFEYSENKEYDILLLDIEMKEINGIELAKRIRKENENVQIVFITGYPDFISEGYDVRALHYLMKPVSKEKLFSVLDMALTNIKHEKKSVLLDTTEGKIKLFTEDILYTEVFAHYIVVHTVGKSYTCRITLDAFIAELDEKGFIRVHRSFAVNLRAVSQITKTDIILDNGEKVPISRRLYVEVYGAFIDYYGKD